MPTIMDLLDKRKNLQIKKGNLKHRIVANSQVQEGDEPSENPNDLIAELEEVEQELLVVTGDLTYWNYETYVGHTRLIELITEREMWKAREISYRDFANQGQVSRDRFSRNEIKFISCIDVKDMQRKADEAAKKARALNALIQRTNILTETEPEE